MPGPPAATAKFETVCKGCFGLISPGHVIVKLDAGWCCTDCARPEKSLEWEQLFQACPERHLQRVYRALAVPFHPDSGGDTETMTAINIANQRIGARR